MINGIPEVPVRIIRCVNCLRVRKMGEWVNLSKEDNEILRRNQGLWRWDYCLCPVCNRLHLLSGVQTIYGMG